MDKSRIEELTVKLCGREHLNRLQLQFGKQIFRQRMELKLTQSDIVELSIKQGKSITQSQLSKIEAGKGNIEIETYQKVFDILGGANINIDFIEDSKNN